MVKISSRNYCIDDKCISEDLFYIGKDFIDGMEGVLPNNKEGMYWIRRSAAAGYKPAIDFIEKSKGMIQKTMDPKRVSCSISNVYV